MTMTSEKMELEKSQIQTKLELEKVRLEQETRRQELNENRTKRQTPQAGPTCAEVCGKKCR